MAVLRATLLASLLCAAAGFVPVHRTAVFGPSSSRAPTTLFASATEPVVAALSDKIRAAIEPTSLEITSDAEDPNGMHVSIDVVAEAFEGLSKVKRQQLVYRAIRDEMNAGIVHAVDAMSTRTPAEAV